jgi:hypothetical protein
LAVHLETLGLVGVEADAEIPMFRGGSPLARMWSLTWEQTHDKLLALGASREVIATAQAELDNKQRWFFAPPTVRAWGRAPE